VVALRDANPADAGALADLAEQSFRDTFGAANSRDDMDAHCAANFGLERQLDEITNPDWRTIVALEDDTLIAFGQLCRSKPPFAVPARRPMEIFRLYVDRPWHGRGVAPLLMDALLSRARTEDADGAWLGVWEHNPRAIAFYRKAGFHSVGEHRFVLGTDVQRDVLMYRPLDH